MNKINNIPKQNILSISTKSSFNPEDYCVSASNQQAWLWINKWPQWSEGRFGNITYLYGKRKSGKTHLAKIWQKMSEAIYCSNQFINNKEFFTETKSNYILENLSPSIEEEPFFHFLNHLAENKKSLLITSKFLPQELSFGLPDLQSRINILSLIRIETPDNELVAQIILKYFSDQHIKITYDAIKFLEMRIERSYEKLFDTLSLLDVESLTMQKKITIPFIKKILKL